jgi:hypothetical protein
MRSVWLINAKKLAVKPIAQSVEVRNEPPTFKMNLSTIFQPKARSKVYSNRFWVSSELKLIYDTRS